jgi:alpha-L-rhamnosidase
MSAAKAMCQKSLYVLTLFTLLSSTVAVSPALATSWTANWIWQPADGPQNTWMAFRKTFTLNSIPSSAITNIAVDSKYWMWINGNLAIFEGGLKRGPTPTDG